MPTGLLLKQGKESVECFYTKASAVWYTWTELFVRSSSPPFLRAVCSTIELNAAKHPVYSEMFSVTNVRSRLASGLASLMANTHPFPWNGLGTNVILSFWCSNRREFFPTKEECLCSVLQIALTQSLYDYSLFLSLCVCLKETVSPRPCICREVDYL